MTDYFELLRQSRKPWLEEDQLKQIFLSISSNIHPDRSHHLSVEKKAEAGKRFSELNSAYNCLRDPKERLRHLLELERGSKPADVQSVSTHLMEWQFKMANLCREADRVLMTKTSGMSPILKVRAFESAQAQIEQLQEFQDAISKQKEELFTRLRRMNEAWISPATADVLIDIEEIYRALGYFFRWSSQLQDRIVQLNLQCI